ncbi:MAG TPA: ABC transporter permease subunit [Acidimicrobiales bacterium]|nr:ABC transporter permease subunit [Acidimicrobiales bacterium]
MSPNVSLASIVRSEWLKFRSVRSSIMGVTITFVLTIGLGALVTSLLRAHWATASESSKLTFDPVSTSLVGVIFAQFAIGVIGALFITSEYSSGSIRTTLAAVPHRVELVLGKLTVLLVSMFVISEVACFATFILGQSIFSGVVPTASLSNSNDLRAVILAGVYLTLAAAMACGIGLILRHSAASISVFVSVILVIPLIFAFLPQSWQNDGAKYLPSELGHAMTSASSVANDFSAWTALILMVIYVVVIVGIGTALFARRDA